MPPPDRAGGPTAAGTTTSGIDVGQLRRALDPPAPGPTATATGAAAAVAAVFREGDDLELLVIQRAANDADPWSGHMALPGGRVDPGDGSTWGTAARETAEEVGLDLSAAEGLGSLTPVDGGRAVGRELVVSGHCFGLGPVDRPRLTPNREVAEVIWLPLAELLDPGRRVEIVNDRTGSRFPGVQLDREDQVIWGLTLRFLGDLFHRLGRPFVV